MSAPWLADMPRVFSSHGIPADLGPARISWKHALHVARTDEAAAADMFFRIAVALKDAMAAGPTRETVLLARVLALENAFETAKSAGQRGDMTARLQALALREPELAPGIAAVVHGQRPSLPAERRLQVLKG